jgi:hypothetical protein
VVRVDEPVYTASSPPRRCRNGHELGPNKVLVNFAHCECDRVKPKSIGHLYWRCNTCGDRIVGDGHSDDSKLFT